MGWPRFGAAPFAWSMQTGQSKQTLQPGAYCLVLFGAQGPFYATLNVNPS